MISYAQNFEDVMLWRALKDVHCGFYIDVGAWSPVDASVTKYFYDQGWCGINIEPNPQFHGQLIECRPRDINLKLALGETDGVLEINFLSNSSLSTFDDAIAKKHLADGCSIKRQEVEVSTLSAIWERYVDIDQSVHFLKIDVEGFESAVLKGNDWGKNRPWIVVVEATFPMSQVECFDSWEPLLLTGGYLFAYADGLNRFYVAREHQGLLLQFKYPPNVFDVFTTRRQLDADAKVSDLAAIAHEAQTEALEAQTRLKEIEQRAVEAEAAFNKIESELGALLNSKSWRFTSPLRGLLRRIRAVRPFGLGWLVAHCVKWLTYRFINLVRKYPWLKSHGLRLAQSLGLVDQIRRLYWYSSGVSSHFRPWVSSTLKTDLQWLGPRAQHIFINLDALIRSRKKIK